jgi:truncated hemoglobin YjbI
MSLYSTLHRCGSPPLTEACQLNHVNTSRRAAWLNCLSDVALAELTARHRQEVAEALADALLVHVYVQNEVRRRTGTSLWCGVAAWRYLLRDKAAIDDQFRPGDE